MRLSVLKTIQTAAAELGLTPPSTVVASNDSTANQLLALFGAVCDELVRDYNWSALHVEYTFPTVYDTDTYPLPEDFQRVVNDTEWNHRTQNPMVGPSNPSAWQRLKNSTISTFNYVFRVKGSNIVIQPVPSIESSNLSLEYISAYYLVDSTTHIPKPAVDSNSDLYVFDDRLIINGIKLKFKEITGLNSEAAAYDYEMTKRSVISSDGGAQVLSLGRSRSGFSNIPDGNWNQ